MKYGIIYTFLIFQVLSEEQLTFIVRKRVNFFWKAKSSIMQSLKISF